MDSFKEDNKEFTKNKKLILRLQQRFRNEKYQVYTEEAKKIALSANNDKRIQSIEWIETYAYGTSKNLVYKKEENKCNYLMKQ